MHRARTVELPPRGARCGRRPDPKAGTMSARDVEGRLVVAVVAPHQQRPGPAAAQRMPGGGALVGRTGRRQVDDAVASFDAHRRPETAEQQPAERALQVDRRARRARRRRSICLPTPAPRATAHLAGRRTSGGSAQTRPACGGRAGHRALRRCASFSCARRHGPDARAKSANPRPDTTATGQRRASRRRSMRSASASTTASRCGCSGAKVPSKSNRNSGL